MQYAILLHPGHNRVYFRSSLALSQTEFSFAMPRLTSDVSEGKIEEIASIPYLTFSSATPLPEEDLTLLARLSFTYGLFLRDGEGKDTCLRPIPLPQENYLPEAARTVLKYSGKTNELFTRLLLTIAYGASSTKPNGRFRLLDPIAGKGTTLVEGLLCGYDAYGMEIQSDSVLAAYQFMKKLLEEEKCKHTAHSQRVSGPGRCFTGKQYTLSFAPDKARMKSAPLLWEMTGVNSRFTDQVYAKNFFDFLVGDLPYGVQHKNQLTKKQPGFTRNPADLVTACAPAWYTVLKPGGALVLAFNAFLLSFADFQTILTQAGFDVDDSALARSLVHRVDQAILRDVIIAKKKQILIVEVKKRAFQGLQSSLSCRIVCKHRAAAYMSMAKQIETIGEIEKPFRRKTFSLNRSP